MKTKLIVFLLTLGTVINISFAQTVKMGVPLSESSKGKLRMMTVTNDNQVYAARSLGSELKYYTGKADYLIQKVTGSRASKGVEVEMKNGKTKLRFNGVYAVGNNAYLLSTERDKKNNLIKLYQQKINSTATKLNPPKLVLSTEYTRLSAKEKAALSPVESYGYQNINGLYRVKKSANGEYLAVYFGVPKRDKTDKTEIISMAVFDADMNKVWSLDKKTAYKSHQFKIEDFEVDNEGNMFFIGLLNKDVLKQNVLFSKVDPKNYTYEILAFSNNGKKERRFPIENENVYISDLKVNIFDDEIVAAGFFAEKVTSNIAGACYFKLNKTTGEMINSSMGKFSQDFVKDGMTLRETKKADKKASKGKSQGIGSLRMDDLVINDNGHMQLIAEQFSISVKTYVSNGKKVYEPTFHFRDIIIVDFDENGEFKYAAKINKSQSTKLYNDPLLSYYAAPVNGEVHIIFNDHISNLSRATGQKYSTYSGGKGVTRIAKVSKSGQVEMSSLFSSTQSSFQACPALSKVNSEGVITFYGENGKKSTKYGTVTY